MQEPPMNNIPVPPNSSSNQTTVKQAIAPKPKRKSPQKPKPRRKDHLHSLGIVETWIVRLFLLVKLVIALVATLLPTGHVSAEQTGEQWKAKKSVVKKDEPKFDSSTESQNQDLDSAIDQEAK
jgi:hypothetical protein